MYRVSPLDVVFAASGVRHPWAECSEAYWRVRVQEALVAGQTLRHGVRRTVRDPPGPASPLVARTIVVSTPRSALGPSLTTPDGQDRLGCPRAEGRTDDGVGAYGVEGIPAALCIHLARAQRASLSTRAGPTEVAAQRRSESGIPPDLCINLARMRCANFGNSVLGRDRTLFAPRIVTVWVPRSRSLSRGMKTGVPRRYARIRVRVIPLGARGVGLALPARSEPAP